MPSDGLTFFIGFAAVFGALGWYLWRLEQEVGRLRRRLDDARAGEGGAATDKSPQEEPRP